MSVNDITIQPVDNVVQLKPKIRNEWSTPEYKLSEADTETFLRVLRHIQSMSMNHEARIIATIDTVKIEVCHSSDRNKSDKDVTSQLHFIHSNSVNGYLPAFDDRSDELNNELIADLTSSTMNAINDLPFCDDE